MPSLRERLQLRSVCNTALNARSERGGSTLLRNIAHSVVELSIVLRIQHSVRKPSGHKCPQSAFGLPCVSMTNPPLDYLSAQSTFFAARFRFASPRIPVFSLGTATLVAHSLDGHYDLCPYVGQSSHCVQVIFLKVEDSLYCAQQLWEVVPQTFLPAHNPFPRIPLCVLPYLSFRSSPSVLL